MNSELATFVPFAYKRRGIQRLAQTVTPAHDTTFLVGLGRAFYWPSLLDARVMASGLAIARAEGLHRSPVNPLLRLTLLAPDIIDQLMAGRQPGSQHDRKPAIAARHRHATAALDDIRPPAAAGTHTHAGR